MTRTDIEAEYTIESGIIRNPGKFENEPIYAPYFYDALLNGMADDDDGKTASFNIEASDVVMFPELIGVKTVRLWESEQGFIYTETYNLKLSPHPIPII